MISGTYLMAFSSPSTPVGSFYNTETLAENAPQEEAQLQIVFYEQHCLVSETDALSDLI